jgi:hypothetical protein
MIITTIGDFILRMDVANWIGDFFYWLSSFKFPF